LFWSSKKVLTSKTSVSLSVIPHKDNNVTP
jgi:hypothetical protein